MAITEANLTSAADTTDATSWTTASITPTTNRLVLAAICNSRATSPTLPTLSGCGLTWVQVATVAYVSDTRRLTLFRALGASPTSGALTIDFAGVTQSAAGWVISEYDGIDTSGTDGSAAIVQSVTDNSGAGVGTTASATLAAFGAAENATFGMFNVNNASGFTAGSGFAEGGDVNVSGLGSLMAEWRNDNDTSVDATMTSGNWGAIAAEIKAAPATQPSDNPPIGFLGRGAGW